ncbi:MAG: type I glyceraldehyde-3-phosphate dehydrogenase [Gemmatimonadaceae bacterium 4484_173]|nr:MAG: type I glyceraldehyde-3-phosphate dehydrogenase [Gemmatimonadaceae bacterium 4484_173]RKZ03051.1 MAG: type I glyceraldehyde-3-phosphate dehydrogenase [Candidatus Fermentibacteria bacterium]
MSVKVAINGFGRIGRLVYRQSLKHNEIDIVAVNDLTDPKMLAHLLKYDSVHGVFPGEVKVDGSRIIAGEDSFEVLSQRDPLKLPWKEMGVDIVVESTGFFRTREKAAYHLQAGAKKVIISAPAKGDPGADLTVVIGVNSDQYDPQRHQIVSTASCTTNCLAPVAKIINDTFGIETGVMTTIHAYTNDQRILDLPHSDMRRARSAAINVIPTTTGAAVAVSLVIPELKGKLDGMAVRVPVPDGSLVDLVCVLKKDATAEDVNRAVKEASETSMKGVLQYTDEPLVSSDIVGNPHSSIFDSGITKMIGPRLLKVLSWYDNELGYSSRMVDMLVLMAAKGF